MIENVFLDVINAAQKSLETSMLEQLPNEQHVMLDLFIGDMRFESSYALPGELNPANVRVDVDFDWPVWSQSVYRSWQLGESDPDLMEVGIEITIRAVCLSEPAPIKDIVTILDQSSPTTLAFALERSSVSTSENILVDGDGNEFELELAYDGTLVIEGPMMKSELEEVLAPLGPWLASMLVRLTDQPLKFLPTPLE